MKKYQLGEFEEIVMLTVGVLYDEAYGVSVKKEIEDRLSRGISVATFLFLLAGGFAPGKNPKEHWRQTGFYSSFPLAFAL
jgi:hypothetical protein